MCEIKVPYYRQTPGSKECWFASTMMVLAYYGKINGETYEDLKEIYRTQKTVNPRTGQGEVTLDMLFQWGGNEVIITQLLEQRGLRARTVYGNKRDLIQQEIRNGRPVILGLNRGDEGHFVVATGMDDAIGNYRILDPLLPGNVAIAIGDPSIASAVFIEQP